jgi:hypothetical protein
MATRYNYTGNMVTQGLVLNLDAAKTDSYPGTGTTWRDLSGFNNNGTLINGPTFSGLGKQASIVFDGTNDGVTISPIPPISQTFTFNLWINKTQSKNSAAIIAIQGTLFQVDNNTISWWSDVNYGAMTYSFTPILNQWYNVCVTQNNLTSNLYINSSLVRTSTMTSVSITRGNSCIGGWSIADRPWLGKISSTQIYNLTLTQTEITQNFNALRGRYGI